MEHIEEVLAEQYQNVGIIGPVHQIDDDEMLELEQDLEDIQSEEMPALEKVSDESLDSECPASETIVNNLSCYQDIASPTAGDRSIEGIEHNQSQQPITATPDTDAAILKLNEGHAVITSIGEIFRFARNDFVKLGTFHLEHSNKFVEADIAGKLRKTTLSDAWLKSPLRRSYEDVVFLPGSDRIVDNNVNLWQGWGCKPKAGDITPWRELLDFVFGDDAVHRKWFEQWAAYPIKYPGFKLNTVVVIWSAQQGVGKTLIGQTIGRIYGSGTYSEITSNDLRGKFNNWSKGCQFVLGEEICVSKLLGESSRLNHLFTGETIQMEEKYRSKISIKNCINFLFTSNHADAFLLDPLDRRYFVWEVQRKPMAPSFYADFVYWRDKRGGAGALMDYFCSMDLSDFDPKGHAPMTAAKEAMIDAGRSDLEQWLVELREEPSHALATLGSEVIELEKLVAIYSLQKKGRITLLDAGKALQRHGPCAKRRIQIRPGKRLWLHAISRVEHWGALPSPAWIDESRKTLEPSILSSLGDS